MKRDVYPVKVIKILPVSPEGPKPPFFKNPHRLAGFYATVRGATVRAALRIRAGAGALTVRGRNAARALRLEAAGRSRAMVSRLKPPAPGPSSENAGQGSRRSEHMGARIVEASRTTIRTLYERVQKRWAILWTAAETALAAKLGALKETWGERMRALEKTLADRRRTFMQRWVRSVGPRNPRRPARATKVDPRQERLTEIRPPDLADLAAELAAVKADVAKHKEVIDDLTRKLAEAQGRSNQPASSPLGPGIAPPSPKPPVSTKRNGHGEAKYHRS